MSYPAFGKVKTIVLPVSSKMPEMSIKDYKKLTGIDLGEYLSLNGGDIFFDAKGACIYIQALDELNGLWMQYGLIKPCVPVTNTRQETNENVHYLHIGTYLVEENAVTGMTFFISESSEQTIDNIVVRFTAI